MTDPTPPLSGLSPVSGKTVITKFDGGLLSSDGGVGCEPGVTASRIHGVIAAQMLACHDRDALNSKLHGRLWHEYLEWGKNYTIAYRQSLIPNQVSQRSMVVFQWNARAQCLANGATFI